MNRLSQKFKLQSGFAAPALILVAVVGLIAFIAVSSIAPLKDQLLSGIFPKESSQAANAVDTSFQDVKVVGGLIEPTAMRFAPDGRLFISEKAGKLRIFKNNQLLPTPFLTVPVNTEKERGLQSIAFDPNFSSNRYLYVFYNYANTNQNRLSRFTADPNNPDLVLAGSELILIDGLNSAGSIHNAGALYFGPDGKLYVSTGDGAFGSVLSQDLNSLNGKILRINPDGSVPSDNPFVGQSGKRGEIWAYGLRNPFTMAFDQDGKLFVNDVGNGGAEEINNIVKGGNYGWPTCEGPCDNPAFINPIYSYGHSIGDAITGALFYRGNKYPAEYNGEYFFGDFGKSWIKRLNPQTNTVQLFATNGNYPIDFKTGPDGLIYYLSYQDDLSGQGAIYKVVYGKVLAKITATPTTGNAPLTVNFSGQGSYDPNGDINLTYSWDFGDGSAKASGINSSHTYNSNGIYTATLTVTNQSQVFGSATATINVGNINPPIGLTSTDGAVPDSNNANFINSSKVTTGQIAGALSSMSVFVGNVDVSPNNKYELAIYSDNAGMPGTLLAKTATGTLVANSWNTLPINATLSANTNYWLAYNNNGTNINVNNMRAISSGNAAWRSQTFGTWPNPFGSFSSQASTFTIYASFGSTSTPVPSPTPSPSPTLNPNAKIVSMQNYQFQPASLTINVGDTVTWVNNDASIPHNIISNTGIWSSPLISAGQSYSRTFTTAGTFPYYCSLHTGMTGTIVVVSNVSPSPVPPSPSPSPTPAQSTAPSPSAVKPGDIDGNNKVDIFDYNILLTNFGKTGTGVQGDLDGNSKVDIFDYNILLTNFGK